MNDINLQFLNEAKNGCVEGMKLTLQQGANINCVCPKDSPILDDWKEKFGYILDKIEHWSCSTSYAIILAAHSQNIEAVEYLIKEGIELYDLDDGYHPYKSVFGEFTLVGDIEGAQYIIKIIPPLDSNMKFKLESNDSILLWYGIYTNQLNFIKWINMKNEMLKGDCVCEEDSLYFAIKRRNAHYIRYVMDVFPEYYYIGTGFYYYKARTGDLDTIKWIQQFPWKDKHSTNEYTIDMCIEVARKNNHHKIVEWFEQNKN